MCLKSTFIRLELSVLRFWYHIWLLLTCKDVHSNRLMVGNKASAFMKFSIQLYTYHHLTYI